MLPAPASTVNIRPVKIRFIALFLLGKLRWLYKPGPTPMVAQKSRAQSIKRIRLNHSISISKPFDFNGYNRIAYFNYTFFQIDGPRRRSLVCAALSLSADGLAGERRPLAVG